MAENYSPSEEGKKKTQKEMERFQALSLREKVKRIAQMIAGGTAFVATVLLTPVTVIREIFHPSEGIERGELESPEEEKTKKEKATSRKEGKKEEKKASFTQEDSLIPDLIRDSKVVSYSRNPADKNKIILGMKAYPDIKTEILPDADPQKTKDAIAGVLDGFSAKALEKDGAFSLPVLSDLSKLRTELSQSSPDFCMTRAASSVHKMTLFCDLKKEGAALGSFACGGKWYEFESSPEKLDIHEARKERSDAPMEQADLPDDVKEVIRRCASHEVAIVKSAEQQVQVSDCKLSGKEEVDGNKVYRCVDGKVSTGKVEAKFHYDLDTKLISFEPSLDGMKGATGISRYLQAYSRQVIRKGNHDRVSETLLQELDTHKKDQKVIRQGKEKKPCGLEGKFHYEGKEYFYFARMTEQGTCPVSIVPDDLSGPVSSIMKKTIAEKVLRNMEGPKHTKKAQIER